MKEQTELVRLQNKDAGFYFNRFIRGTQLIMAIDDGAFGDINWFTGSSQMEEDDTFTLLSPVNICERPNIKNAMTGQRQRGLRFGIQRGAIWGSYQWLTKHGFKEEVDLALEHIRATKIQPR